MITLSNNNIRITFGSFLAYFAMSAIISPLGLVSGPIAIQFNVSITAATAAFTYLTSGVLLGTLMAVFVFDYVRLRQVVIACAVAICLSIYAIYALDSFPVFTIALALIGAGCGIELSAAAVVIAKIYEEKLRASMLLLTDSFYSVAGLISTSLAGVLLAKNYHWASAYLLAFCVSLLIALVAFSGRYPATRKKDVDPETSMDAHNWPLAVHCIGLAMLCYLVGFVSIYSWVPNYAQEAMALSAETASEIVSRFFLGMFIGQLVMFFLVLRFPLRALIVVYCAMATLLTVSLWTTNTAPQLELAMLVLGLVTGGLFKTVLSYGTTLVSRASPKMVSYLIFHAGLGTAIAPFVSSWIVERDDMAAALQFATFCYVLTWMLIITAIRLQSRHAGNPTESLHE